MADEKKFADEIMSNEELDNVVAAVATKLQMTAASSTA